MFDVCIELAGNRCCGRPRASLAQAQKTAMQWLYHIETDPASPIRQQKIPYAVLVLERGIEVERYPK